jgi:hypothetical protein
MGTLVFTLIRYGILILLFIVMSVGKALAMDVPDDHIGVDRCESLADMEYGFRKLYQAEEDWLFRQADIVESFEMGPEALVSLKRINKKLESDGVKLMLVPVPSRGLVYPKRVPESTGYNYQKAKSAYLSWVELMQSNGIQVVDMSRLLGSGDEMLFYKRDLHWTYVGAKTVAGIVSESIRESEYYPEFMQDEFSTEYVGVSKTDGMMQRIYASKCQQQYPYEYKRQFYTNKITGDTLFGDEKENNDVVLLGTSFSKKAHYNFLGYLSEDLGVEVVNYAIGGGGVSGSFSHYFSEVYNPLNAPKIIVWEFPINYAEIGKKNIYSLMLPHLFNTSCAQEVVASIQTLKQGVNTVLFNAGDDFKFLPNEKLIFELDFDDEEVYEFYSTLFFVEGRKFHSGIKRTTRLSGAGKFVLDFSYVEKLDGLHFMSMDIDIKDTSLVGSKIRAKVCLKNNV